MDSLTSPVAIGRLYSPDLDKSLLDPYRAAKIPCAFVDFEDQYRVQIINIESGHNLLVELSSYNANQGNICIQFDSSVYNKLLLRVVSSNNVYPPLLQMHHSIASTIL
jgi:hypothetical protein